jgi:glycosyltransferase involved in cell wall biosynthesis
MFNDYSDTTIIVPVKDEPYVKEVIEDIENELKNCKIILIYSEKANNNKKYPNLEIIKQTGSGKGAACIQAMKKVKTKISCFIDGDATYDVKDLKNLIKEVRNGADMAIGNRFEKMDKNAMPRYVIFGNNILTFLENLLYGLNIKDSQTGLRAFKTEIFKKLNITEKEFGIESEMNIKAKKMNYKIVEVPINYHSRKDKDKPKHFKPLGGFKLLIITFKYLFKK